MLRKRGTALALAGVAVVALACAPDREVPREPAVLRLERPLMGTTFRVRVVSIDRASAQRAMLAALDEVARVEAILSEWKDSSDISAVNRRAGGAPVRVAPELVDVLERAERVRRWTSGSFDVTFAACGRLWSFRDRRVPSRQRLDACLASVDGSRVEVDPVRGTVRLPDADMRIGIAGIGKGYGVDRAAEVLERHGIVSYAVDGGGDVRLRGSRPDRPWRIGIADPRAQGRLIGTVVPGDGAIVTSGDYERAFTVDGVRYHHILDPSTGFPARGAVSVTVIAPTATEADALATGLFVLGADRAIDVAEAIAGIEALVIAPDLTTRSTTGFPGIDPP